MATITETITINVHQDVPVPVTGDVVGVTDTVTFKNASFHSSGANPQHIDGQLVIVRVGDDGE